MVPGFATCPTVWNERNPSNSFVCFESYDGRRVAGGEMVHRWSEDGMWKLDAIDAE